MNNFPPTRHSNLHKSCLRQNMLKEKEITYIKQNETRLDKDRPQILAD